MPMIRHSIIGLLAILTCAWAVAAQAKEPLTKITFATDWKAQAEHGGFYQALAKGFYKSRGLDVTIRPGGPQTDNPRLMAAGALDIAMASNSFQPINLIAAGADVKVVMAAFQKDPQVMMVHPHVLANGLADLKGRPVFLADSAIATVWPWLKARFGYADKDIRKYSYSLAPWLANPETVQEGYVSSEPFTAEQAGVAPKVFLLSDAGYPGYSAMVMVRGDYINSNKPVVAAFVAASVEGWRDYLWGDPTPANMLILKDNPEMTPALIANGIAVMRRNQMVGDPDSIGQMSHARWQKFYVEMSDLGIIDKGLDVRDAYTLEFVLPENAN